MSGGGPAGRFDHAGRCALPGRRTRRREIDKTDAGAPMGQDRPGWYARSPRKGGAVDFGAVLRRVSAFLNDQGYRFALIGGVALAAYGSARTTETGAPRRPEGRGDEE